MTFNRAFLRHKPLAKCITDMLIITEVSFSQILILLHAPLKKLFLKRKRQAK